MIIQEAIKSGKPFRRPIHDYWMIVFQSGFFKYQPVEKCFSVKLEISPKKIKKNKWEKSNAIWTDLTMPELPQILTLTSSSVLANDWEIKE